MNRDQTIAVVLAYSLRQAYDVEPRDLAVCTDVQLLAAALEIAMGGQSRLVHRIRQTKLAGAHLTPPQVQNRLMLLAHKALAASPSTHSQPTG